jgi:hypothetical protein
MRKRRTRAHIIEDLGFNHFERQVFLAGYTVERIRYDYGYDGYFQTFNDNGEIEANSIFIQLKSTDNLKSNGKEQNSIIFDLSIRDLELWLLGKEMMLLIVYDAKLEQAFFVDLRAYFSQNKEALINVNKFVRVYIPNKNILNPAAVKQLRTIKNSVYGRS